mgnify:CR=1 FL=1
MEETKRQSVLKMVNVDKMLTYFNSFPVILEWIDYSRVVLQDKLEFFEKLPLNNTNKDSYKFFWEWNEINISQISIDCWKSYHVSIVWNDSIVPLFLYTIFWNRKWFDYKSYWAFTIYGSAWKWSLMNQINLDNFIQDNFGHVLFEIVNNSQLTRVDYRFDLCSKEKMNLPWPFFVNPRHNVKFDVHFKWWKKLFKNEKAKLWIFKDFDFDYESWGYWSKRCDRIYIRMYDKLIEAKKMWKLMLYNDYFQYKTVHRLEFELLNKFNRGYMFKDINWLVKKLRQLLLLDTDKFTGNIYYTPPVVEKNYYKFDMETNMTMFKWLSQKAYYFYMCGYNPLVSVLQSMESKNNRLKKWDEINIEMMIDSFNKYVEYKYPNLKTQWDFVEKLLVRE